jgi:hypothetical protein
MNRDELKEYDRQIVYTKEAKVKDLIVKISKDFSKVVFASPKESFSYMKVNEQWT